VSVSNQKKAKTAAGQEVPGAEEDGELRRRVASIIRARRDELAERWEALVARASENSRERPEGDVRVDFRKGIDALARAAESGDLSQVFAVTDAMAERRWQTQFVVSEMGRALYLGTRLIFQALASEIQDPRELMRATRIVDDCCVEGLFRYFQIYQRLAVAEVERQTRLRAGAEEEAKFARERERLQEQLRSQEAQVAAVVEESADAIIALDTDSIVLCWNRGAEMIFGYARSEMIGRSIEVIVPDHLVEARELEMITRQVREKGFVRDYETVRVAKDGRRVLVDLTATAICDKEGRIIGKSSILRDISDRKRLQERVFQTERLATIGRMAARVAHEVRNPLSSITLNVDLLADELRSYGMVDTSEAEALLESINGELERLNQVVRDYLSFSRPPDFKFEPRDITTVIEDLLAFLDEEMTKHGIRLELTSDGSIPPVSLDVHKIREAFLNLYKNSLEALPEGGEITTAIEAQGGEVVIRIKDTGVGIPEEQLDTIFEPFMSTKEGGTGLGLSVAREIIAEHQGTITCESRPGEGAAFEIRLPIGARPQSNALCADEQ
jgi:PAS domain S-box-containing protein